VTDDFDYSCPPYFSNWRSRTWQCPECAWAGTGADLAMEQFAELQELHCPRCDHKFGLLLHPNLEETRAAAQAGNDEALKHLQVLELLEGRLQQIEAAREAELPEVAGDRLTFHFTPEGGHDPLSPHWLVLECDGKEIYREPSGYEGWRAIIDISERVLRTYPGRVAWIDPDNAGMALLGDNLSADGHIEDFLRENRIQPPDGRWSDGRK